MLNGAIKNTEFSNKGKQLGKESGITEQGNKGVNGKVISILSKPNTNLQENKIEEIDYSKIKVLFVDDNDTNQLIGKRILAKMGIINKNIVVVSNGKLAIDAVTEGEFDIILMDRQMPIMGGDKATREIKKLKPYIPIVSLTGTPEGIEDQCYDDYLTKPYSVVNFIDYVKKNIIKNSLN